MDGGVDAGQPNDPSGGTADGGSCSGRPGDNLRTLYFGLNSQFVSYSERRAFIAGHVPYSGDPYTDSVTVLGQRATTRRGMTNGLSLSDSRQLFGWLNLQPAMRDELGATRDELVRRGYAGPIMMIHSSGGLAEVRKTSAVETCNGGPLAGLLGAAFVGRVVSMASSASWMHRATARRAPSWSSTVSA